MSNETCVMTDLFAKCPYMMSLAMNWYVPVSLRERERVIGIKCPDGPLAYVTVEAEHCWVEAACVASVRFNHNVLQIENDRLWEDEELVEN